VVDSNPCCPAFFSTLQLNSEIEDYRDFVKPEREHSRDQSSNAEKSARELTEKKR
jgi:hypothetical protein